MQSQRGVQEENVVELTAWQVFDVVLPGPPQRLVQPLC